MWLRIIRPSLLILLLVPWLGGEAIPAKKKRHTIGRVEYIEIPNWGGLRMEARTDTGARSCSLHVTNEKTYKEQGVTYVEFETEDSKGKKYHVRTRVYQRSFIRSTSGQGEYRTVVRERVKLGPVTKTVRISLNDRSKLKYNFLIGRNLLIGKFVVDVSLSHTMGD